VATQADLIARIRRELGDEGQSFQTSVMGDGVTTRFDLPVGLVDEATFQALVLPAAGPPAVALTSADYQLTDDGDSITLTNPLGDGDTLIAQGSAFTLFSDSELTQYVNDAFLQHTHDRTQTIRVRQGDGYIGYVESPMTLATLPPVEDYLVATLATIQALWTLQTDAATDVDVNSAEGTHVPRGQRFGQVRQQIADLTQRYTEMCQQLQVGLARIEISTLRRVSRQTGRLVPIFKEREYDDHRLPDRSLPNIDLPNEDESGIPSPAWGAFWGI
jgi:hypothetical protein